MNGIKFLAHLSAAHLPSDGRRSSNAKSIHSRIQDDLSAKELNDAAHNVRIDSHESSSRELLHYKCIINIRRVLNVFSQPKIEYSNLSGRFRLNFQSESLSEYQSSELRFGLNLFSLPEEIVRVYSLRTALIKT
ncbi:hypothetical protein CDAR_26051 [Caerostris darwini]|uniref:Uncharacterized protein n=1 Tax=Caerostris darwini TaxID=1538125 RepID=A0AAV4MUD2_9ARAC|nr:hypothetical protein CDAR_26051 [Caerostris darwini]